MTPLLQDVIIEAFCDAINDMDEVCSELQEQIGDYDRAVFLRDRFYAALINLGVLYEAAYPTDKRVELGLDNMEACALALSSLFKGTHAPSFADA